MQAALERHARAGLAEQPAGNPFFETWALDAASRHLADTARPVDIVAADGSDAGAVPLSPWLNAPAGLGSVWTVWDHIHCFDTTPAGAGDVSATVGSILDHLNENGASMLRWSALPTDTAFYGGLMAHLARAGLEFQVTKSTTRPVLHADDARGSGLLPAYIGSKRLREFRRCRRRLEETGRLEFRVYDGPHAADAWVDDFLALEASGWKAAQGTAMACRPNEKAFFTELSRRVATAGRVLVYALELQGRPIAMSVNLRSGSRIWCFKTAYDAKLARFSPGALLEYESTVAALDDPSIAWLDACTSHDQGLMGELWPGRREVVDLLIAVRPAANWLPGAAKLALATVRMAKAATAPLRASSASRAQTGLFRAVERSISRIVTGITSIVVLPEMPTVVLMTASI